jgi:sulfur-oxidizing protein SoxY
MRTSPHALAMAPARIGRRSIVVAGCGLVLVQPSRALSSELLATVARYSGGAAVHSGRVEFEIAPLVENGNAVPITIDVASPMNAADHVLAVAVFNERNPQRDVAIFTLGPRAGRARVSTRIRLATSQQLVAVARFSDGSFWSRSVDVVVTLAACIE